MPKPLFPEADQDFAESAQVFSTNIACDPQRYFLSHEDARRITRAAERFCAAHRIANAKVTRKIGVGCGLKPLTFEELLRLTPNAKDLEAIGNEVGKKLDAIGKDLGLPPVPSGLPALPPFPKLPDLSEPPKKKNAAEPAPAGSAK